MCIYIHLHIYIYMYLSIYLSIYLPIYLSYWSQVYLIFRLTFSFYFLVFKGKYYAIVLSRKENVKYTDSFDVTGLSTCYVRLLFKCYYLLGSWTHI